MDIGLPCYGGIAPDSASLCIAVPSPPAYSSALSVTLEPSELICVSIIDATSKIKCQFHVKKLARLSIPLQPMKETTMERVNSFFSAKQKYFNCQNLLERQFETGRARKVDHDIPTGASTVIIIDADGAVKCATFTEATRRAHSAFEDAVLVGRYLPDEIFYVQYANGGFDPTAARLADRFAKGDLTAEHVRQHVAARKKETAKLLEPNQTR